MNNSLTKYITNFISGFKDSKLGKKELLLNNSDINSIAYNDGYVYAKDNESLKDLYFDNNYKKAIDKLNLFSIYKENFIKGYENAFLRFSRKSNKFNIIPDINDDSLVSIAYLDGYSYMIRKVDQIEALKELGEEVYIDDFIEVNNSFIDYYNKKNKCKVLK